MNLIEKLEKSLALAKDLNLNDTQIRDLFAIVLDLPANKISIPWISPTTTPWSPNTNEPYPISPTIICSE